MRNRSTPQEHRLNLKPYVQRACADVKYRQQVHEAHKLLSESALATMRMEELFSKPCAGVLRDLLGHSGDAQEGDWLSAVEALNVLQELIAEIQLSRPRVDD